MCYIHILLCFSYEQIQAAVSKYSVERTDHLKQTLPERRRENAYVAQMPVPYSTLGNKKIYFQPGIDMRKPGEHPASLTDVILPNPTSTHMQWHDGMLNGLKFHFVLRCGVEGGETVRCY